jgi:hypothetical protein
MPHAAHASALSAALAVLLFPGGALAAATEAGVSYNPEGGSELLKTLAGAGYILLVVVYFVRLFMKRAKGATSVPLASTAQSEQDDEALDEDLDEELQQEGEVTPLQCFM